MKKARVFIGFSYDYPPRCSATCTPYFSEQFFVIVFHGEFSLTKLDSSNPSILLCIITSYGLPRQNWNELFGLRMPNGAAKLSVNWFSNIAHGF